jgi:hypothetical protein
MERYAIIDNDYVLFENGVVLSLKINRFLNGNIGKQGYVRFDIHGKFNYLHRMLAEAFVANPDNKPFVDHIDRVRSNNHVSNLRWCTMSENNCNRNTQSNNKTGEECISQTHKGKHHYWNLDIRANGVRYRENFRCEESDTVIPEYIIKLRDDKKKELHKEFSSK